MKDNSTPDITEFSRTARRNILNALGISGKDPDQERPANLQDRLAKEMQGTFTFELIEADTGEVVQQVEQNTVVNEGENSVLNWIAGNDPRNTGVTYDGWRYLAVGTDNTSVTDSDTSLGSESSRVDLDPNTNSGEYSIDTGAVEITGTWLFGTSEANVDIAEAALFYVPPGDATVGTSDDYMLNRTVVSPAISKSSSQELKVTWTLSM
jgi:hypothetical protein